MIWRYFTTTLIISLLSNASFADSHLKPDVKTEFLEAVKSVEKKDYSKAFEIFSNLSDLGYPEAQYNVSVLYLNGLGSPKNYRLALYWSWQAYLNEHKNAMDRVTSIIDLTNDDLRNSVAQQIIDELIVDANVGNMQSPLKLGKTFLELFVEPDLTSAYLWLSISQAYGDESASDLLKNTADQMTMEEILVQQEEALKTFNDIIDKKN